MPDTTGWRCRATRSHGVCNTSNSADEGTCGACGADRATDTPAARRADGIGIALAILAATKNVDALYDAAKSLLDRVYAAEARAVKAEADVARLDALESLGSVDILHNHDGYRDEVWLENPDCEARERRHGLGRTLRAAIDAARRETDDLLALHNVADIAALNAYIGHLEGQSLAACRENETLKYAVESATKERDYWITECRTLAATQETRSHA